MILSTFNTPKIKVASPAPFQPKPTTSRKQSIKNKALNAFGSSSLTRSMNLALKNAMISLQEISLQANTLLTMASES